MDMRNLFAVGSGTRFKPSDVESIYYLFKKVSGKPLLFDELVIKKRDLYGDQEPWEICRCSAGNLEEEKTGYFYYTRLKKKSPNAKRYCRTVGKRGGTWSGVDKGLPIFNQYGHQIGFKKSFVYERKGLSKQQKYGGCRWLMKEYSLGGSLLGVRDKIKIKRHEAEDDDDLVLCIIKRKDIVEENNRQIDLESGTVEIRGAEEILDYDKNQLLNMDQRGIGVCDILNELNNFDVDMNILNELNNFDVDAAPVSITDNTDDQNNIPVDSSVLPYRSVCASTIVGGQYNNIGGGAEVFQQQHTATLGCLEQSLDHEQVVHNDFDLYQSFYSKADIDLMNTLMIDINDEDNKNTADISVGINDAIVGQNINGVEEEVVQEHAHASVMTGSTTAAIGEEILEEVVNDGQSGAGRCNSQADEDLGSGVNDNNLFSKEFSNELMKGNDQQMELGNQDRLLVDNSWQQDWDM